MAFMTVLVVNPEAIIEGQLLLRLRLLTSKLCMFKSEQHSNKYIGLQVSIS